MSSPPVPPSPFENGGREGTRPLTNTKVTGVEMEELHTFLKEEEITNVHPHLWPAHQTNPALHHYVDNQCSRWFKLHVIRYRNGNTFFQGPARVRVHATEKLLTYRDTLYPLSCPPAPPAPPPPPSDDEVQVIITAPDNTTICWSGYGNTTIQGLKQYVEDAQGWPSTHTKLYEGVHLLPDTGTVTSLELGDRIINMKVELKGGKRTPPARHRRTRPSFLFLFLLTSFYSSVSPSVENE